MFAQLRANAILLVATLIICSVLYPLAILAVGQGLFAEKASGSLIRDGEKIIGSRLIAQKFEDAGYFQPRPSAAGYNAAASGGSNYGANNIRLRQRVAAQLSGLVTYNSGPGAGKAVGPDVTLWFLEQTDPKKVQAGVDDLVSRWARDYPTLASDWIKSDLAKDHVADWHKKHSDVPEDQVAQAFFASFAREHPQQWPRITEQKDAEGKAVKKVELIPANPAEVKKREDAEGLTEIPEIFFDLWLQAHPQADMEKVPADMVTTSGSGLDPHISLASARYQSKRVVAERSKRLVEKETARTGAPVPEGRAREIREQVQKAVEGLLGTGPLVNVLETNRALDERLKQMER